ncbi:MAG: SDR family NAD(P)-dependent oxidoreductase [Parabacteroides sp.]|nr:SDR family NAD(P)-dependent oxidoreductase [Parabacteroides sp.]
MYNPYSLEGKTILITGASSGIGKSAAIECSKLGAKVIITARNKERLEKTFSALDGTGHSILLCDLIDFSEITKMVAKLPEIQGVINNAGYTEFAPVQFINEDVLQNMMGVNTIAPIIILRSLVKMKKLKKGASVVFTSSLSGLGRTSIGNTMYASTKGAISAFIQGAALELSAKGIRVNAVCPGMVETNILSNGTVSSEQIEEDKKIYPLKRYGRPEEVAWAMIYLLSDASLWTTGTNLIIDGGYSIR